MQKRADALFSEDQQQLEIQPLHVATHSESSDGAAWELVGMLRHAEKHYREAAAALERATVLKPLSVDAQFALADSYLELDDRQLAYLVYLHLYDGRRFGTERLPEVIRGLATLGDDRRALTLCREAVESNPDCEEAWHRMACYMSKCGYPKETLVPVLRKVVDLAPDVIQFRVEFATLLVELGQDEAAFHVLSRITRTQIQVISTASCLYKIATLFMAIGDASRFEECQLRLNDIRPR